MFLPSEFRAVCTTIESSKRRTKPIRSSVRILTSMPIDPLSPITLPGGLELANRLVVAPMTTYSSLPDGVISPDELPYLQRRSKGGFGAVMTAACCVHPSGWAFRGQWQCSDDRFMDSLRSVADAIHAGGSKAILQIHHGGRQCPPDLAGGECVSASAIPSERPNAPVPRALEHDEILEIIDAFAAATDRARRAGFDAVEIHGANTYLLQQFVSPHSNRRKDAWGQDRLKFPLAVTDACLAAANGLPVGYRFSPEEPETPGIRLPNTLALVDALAQRPLAFLHISLRRYDQPSIHGGDEPVVAPIVNQIAGRLPLITVGAVKTHADAKAALDLGPELVAVGRTAISDPEFVEALESGRETRKTVPHGAFAEQLTLPQGLAERIDAVEGWFERG